VEEAATSSAQADSVSGDGVRDDCAGAEDAREGGGGATVQMESHQDGQAVTEDAAGKGEDIEGQVATANHGQPGPDVSDAAGAGIQSAQWFWACSIVCVCVCAYDDDVCLSLCARTFDKSYNVAFHGCLPVHNLPHLTETFWNTCVYIRVPRQKMQGYRKATRQRRA